MKLIKAFPFQSPIKQVISGKYGGFLILMIIVCMLLIETAVCKIEYNPEDFGSSKSEPIDSGFYFRGGKYIDAPYIVERRGLNLYINDTLIRKGPINELYNYSVDTDPGDPPPGVSPFDEPPEGSDMRDSFFSKKWRYLYTHYEYETAMNMMFETYKKCTELDNVYWLIPGKINIVDKKTGWERTVSLGLRDGGKARNQPTKEELIERVEKRKKNYEELLKIDSVSFETNGFALSSGSQNAFEVIKVLLSDVSDSEKFRILDEKRLFPGCKDEFPWIVTEFEASSQLKERIDSLEKKNLSKNIARETSYILDNPIFAPDLDSIHLEEETTTKLPNDIPASIDESVNSSDDSSPDSINTKTISQIENPSNNSKRIIILSFFSIGMISLLILHIYRHRRMKSQD